MSPPPKLYRQLKASFHECPLSHQKFLPLDSLDTAITKDRIKDALPGYFRILHNGLPGRVVQHAKKAFAILVLIEQAAAIKDLLAEGFTDEHLPLSLYTAEGNEKILISHNGSTFRSFQAWKSDVSVEVFLEKQWLMLAPVLDTTGKHIILSPKCALPLLEAKELRGSSYSLVYKSALHPAHQHGLKGKDSRIQIATKEFWREESFAQEKENLDKTRSIRHQHLIQHIATLQRSDRYYALFPWADGGNLKEFWQNKDSKTRTPELVQWSLQQMIGLAGALKELHTVNCRHGDLKPENILYFQEGKKGRLVVADVGVSRVHIQATHMRHDPTATRATTPAYEAPEVLINQTSPRARRYDIWSMGCIFLEFVIWLLYDHEAIKEFEKARHDIDANCSPFYKRTDHDAAKIHPKVSDVIETLRQDPQYKDGTALKPLVDLIAEHLLLIDVDRRDTAEAVHDKLENIVSDGVKDPSYLFKQADSLTTKRSPF